MASLQCHGRSCLPAHHRDDCIVPMIRSRSASGWRRSWPYCFPEPSKRSSPTKRSSRPGRAHDRFARKGITQRPTPHDPIRFGRRDPAAIGLPRKQSPARPTAGRRSRREVRSSAAPALNLRRWLRLVIGFLPARCGPGCRRPGSLWRTSQQDGAAGSVGRSRRRRRLPLVVLHGSFGSARRYLCAGRIACFLILEDRGRVGGRDRYVTTAANSRSIAPSSNR